MWFGIAPAPVLSPRTNTKTWHPPHCTCTKHGGRAGASEAVKLSPRKNPGHTGGAPQNTSIIASPRTGKQLNTSSPASPRHRSPRKDPTTVSQASKTQLGPPSPPKASFRHNSKNRSGGSGFDNDNNDGATTVNGRASILPGLPGSDRPYVRRPSRRMSKSLISPGDDWSQSSKCDHQPEHDDLTAHKHSRESENNNTRTDDWPTAPPTRPRTRAADTTDLFSRAPSPSSSGFAAVIPAPSQSRRGSRSRSRAGGERHAAAVTATTAPADGTWKQETILQSEGCVRLTPPMSERAQPNNLVGHTSSVSTVLVDNDQYIVSASIDGSVKIWSRITLDCVDTLYGHEDTVSCVDLSQRWLVSGSHDTTLRVYDSANRFRFLHSLVGHHGHVTRVALLTEYAAVHQLVLSCSDDASLRLWDVESSQCISLFKSHTSRITCLLVLRHHHQAFCSGSADASICFWSLTDIVNHSKSSTTCDQVATCTSFKSLRVHKATVQCLLPGTTRIAGEATTGGGGGGRAAVDEVVFSCSNDGTIQWFDAHTWHHLGCIDSVQSPVYSMAIHPAANYLVCSTGDGRLLMYSDWSTRASIVQKRELKVSPKWISSLQLLRGHLLACASEDDLYVVNLDRPRIDRVISTAHGFLTCVRWLKPEKLVTSGEDNVINVWSIL